MKEKLLILIGRIGKEARVGKITTKVQSNVLFYGIFPIHSVCFIIISLDYSLQVTVIVLMHCWCACGFLRPNC